MHPAFLYLTLSIHFAILFCMKKKKITIRKTCIFCGSKRFLKNMYFANFKTGGQYACVNNDLCVLKMSFNKKKKKICKKH